jgi:DNA-binding HxlR family transcriptional regulator
MVTREHAMPLKLRKNRAVPPPPSCPLTECMALLGGAWTPNVIWYLSSGPRRFGELRRDIPPISAKMLSARLRELEAKGVLTRAVAPTSPPSVEYALTALGRELMPAINAIVDIGLRLKSAAATPRQLKRRRIERVQLS